MRPNSTWIWPGLALFVGWFPSQMVLGSVLVAFPHQETTTPILSDLGTILQLPSPVKTVTPARYFKIRDVAQGAEGSRTDVRTFHVIPASGAKAEPVTFVLADGKALALKLVPTAGADKFLDVKLDSSLKKSRDQKFLGSELMMMRAMIMDESGGFAREILDQKIDSPWEVLSLRLSRIYAADGLTGYVFRAQNNSRTSIDLNPSTFGFGHPNRAILAHGDKQKLLPCSLLSEKPDCEAALHLVVRGAKEGVPRLTFDVSGVPPFVKTDATPPSAGGPQ